MERAPKRLMSRVIRTFAVLGATLACGWTLGAARADTIALSNTTEVAYYNEGNPYSVGGYYWGAPSIGAPTYYTPSANITTVNNGNGTSSITIQFNTGLYSGTDTQYLSAYGITIDAADIFIKSGGGSSLPVAGTSGFYNYAIALGFDSGDGGYSSPGLYESSSDPGGALSSSEYKTSNQIWTGSPSDRKDFYYGGEYAPASAFESGGACVSSLKSTTPCSVAQPSPTVLLDNSSSEEVGGISVTEKDCEFGTAGCTEPSNADGATGSLSVTLTGATGLLESIFSDFDIFWGTGDCSNAPIWGDVTNVAAVPEPSTLAILASALVLLGFAARRRRRAAALS